MIKKVIIRNFRKHIDSNIILDPKLTVIVGENDTGKSSLISAIQIITSNLSISRSDFYESTEEILIEIEVNDYIFGVKAKVEDTRVDIQRYCKISARIASGFKTDLDSKVDRELKNIADELGVKFTNVMRDDTIRGKISDKLSETYRYNKGFFLIEGSRNFPLISYSLSGIEFESVDKFISETFFKSKQKDIWNSEVNGVTLSEFIQSKLEVYKEETESEIKASGIIEVIKSYMDSIDKIEVYPEFDRRDINVNLSVKLLTSAGENRTVNAFGDGTRRRLTIALLQHKATVDTSKSLYLFDEPDTHLHVRAQNDLLNAFDIIADSGSQVIVTTHSPFILNSVDVKQVRLLTKYADIVSIKGNMLDEDDKTDVLKNLGIENIHLFFSRSFLIVEGETEEMFIKVAYKRMFGRELGRDFIKLVNMRGVNNITSFHNMLVEFISKQDIYIIADRDSKDLTKELIDRLPESNVHYIGEKEFEDSFSPEVVYLAWMNYLESNSITPGNQWTSDNLEKLYLDQTKRREGLGSHLTSLNAGCSMPLEKITMGLALALYCREQHLPENILTLMRILNSSSQTQA